MFSLFKKPKIKLFVENNDLQKVQDYINTFLPILMFQLLFYSCREVVGGMAVTNIQGLDHVYGSTWSFDH